MLETDQQKEELYRLSDETVRRIASEVNLSPDEVDFIAVFDRHAVLRIALAPKTVFLTFDPGWDTGAAEGATQPRIAAASSDDDVFSEVTVYKCGRRNCGNNKRRIKVQYQDGSPSESWCERCPG